MFSETSFCICVSTKNCKQVSEWKLKVSELVEVVERNEIGLLFPSCPDNHWRP